MARHNVHLLALVFLIFAVTRRAMVTALIIPPNLVRGENSITVSQDTLMLQRRDQWHAELGYADLVDASDDTQELTQDEAYAEDEEEEEAEDEEESEYEEVEYDVGEEDNDADANDEDID